MIIILRLNDIEIIKNIIVLHFMIIWKNKRKFLKFTITSTKGQWLQMVNFEILKGDITKLEVDAIVNAAMNMKKP